MKRPKIIPGHQPAEYDTTTIAALRALAEGVAVAGQQKMALRWIIEEAARTYDQPFRPGPDGARQTDFACGRMFVGQQIVKVMKLVPKEGT